MSDLSVQERSDEWLKERLIQSDNPPHPANIAISALRLVKLHLKRMKFLPIGQDRRLIEDVASPNAAQSVFAILRTFVDNSPGDSHE